MELEPLAEDADPRRRGRELVSLVWRRSFQTEDPVTEAERAVHQRLLNLVAEQEDEEDTALTSILLRDVSAKMLYLDPDWGVVDASNVGKSFNKKTYTC
jgi:nitric oxide reductase activation protein